MAAPNGPPLPPVRLCCMQRHYGPVCPDGKVMCCLCFERVEIKDLAMEYGEKVDVCRSCRKEEIEEMARRRMTIEVEVELSD